VTWKGEKVWAIPYDYKNGCAEAPDVCLGVPYFNWGPVYLKTVKDFQAGTWKPSWDWNGPDWKDIHNPDTRAVGFTVGKALSADPKATFQVRRTSSIGKEHAVRAGEAD
jgi:simple sugar transport system substrate-binding protein